MRSCYFQSKTRQFHLMQVLILQKNVYLEGMVYNFFRMAFNLVQALTYQNDSFYTDCLVLLHSFCFLQFKISVAF